MSNTANLKKDYLERIVPALQKEFNYSTVMLFPVSATSKVSKANSMDEEIIPSEFRNKLFSLKLISIVLPKLWE